MDELGRGTSTFDGTALASACVASLIENNKCLTLFATHYHSLLKEWQDEPSVWLGHMQCYVEGGVDEASEEAGDGDHNITFLYTLGEGSCPKSFGISVAKLAGLPDDVLSNAKQKSTAFEKEMNGDGPTRKVTAGNALQIKDRIEELIAANNFEELERLWGELN
jgi:DNA mismatch repair protein MSH6